MKAYGWDVHELENLMAYEVDLYVTLQQKKNAIAAEQQRQLQAAQEVINKHHIRYG